MNSFSGDQTFLDTADRFFLDLVKIPDYTLRAQAMLQVPFLSLLLHNANDKKLEIFYYYRIFFKPLFTE